MKILITSIFCDGKNGYIPPNEIWYQIQIQFLKKTTRNFDHAVALSGELDESIFKDSMVFSREKTTSCESYISHMYKILDLFRKNKENYDAFLILDSDAFPILKGWDSLLIEEMNRRSMWYSSPLRIENFDDFPHFCCMYINSHFVDEDFLNFEAFNFVNVIGENIREIGAGNKKNVYGKQIWLPLLKTNIWSPHPIISSIYSHIFYHHGAGSRGKIFRCDNSLLFNDRKIMDVEQIQNKLFNNPENFIQKLIGKSFF